MRPARARGAAALVLLGLLLAGCDGGSDDSAAVSAAGVAEEPDPAAAVARTGGAMDELTAGRDSSESLPAGASGGASAAEKKSTSAVADSADASAPSKAGTDRSENSSSKARNVALDAISERDIIHTAEMQVAVAEVPAASDAVEQAVTAAGGLVAQSERYDRGREDGEVEPYAQLTLRVPTDGFGSLLERIGKLGEVRQQTTSAQDVTEQVVDVASRIDSQRASVARIQELMDRAADLSDVVRLESELGQRQADLDALLAKQEKLRDQTALATITVTLVDDATETDTDEELVGFVGGLRQGWDGFTSAAVVAATVVGAVLPFAVALVILGPPLLWLGLRTRRAVSAAAARRWQSEDAVG